VAHYSSSAGEFLENVIGQGCIFVDHGTTLCGPADIEREAAFIVTASRNAAARGDATPGSMDALVVVLELSSAVCALKAESVRADAVPGVCSELLHSFGMGLLGGQAIRQFLASRFGHPERFAAWADEPPVALFDLHGQPRRWWLL
jgi:hypothetical protein